MPYPPYYQQGVNYQGSEVFADPVLFGRVITTGKGIQAGGFTPTVAAGSTQGTAATITSQVGTDQAGSFVLTTGTQTPLGGTIATVTFGEPLPAAPASVNVTFGNTTAGATTTIAAGAIALGTTGFSIQGAATAASSTYLVSYQVFRQT